MDDIKLWSTGGGVGGTNLLLRAFSGYRYCATSAPEPLGNSGRSWVRGSHSHIQRESKQREETPPPVALRYMETTITCAENLCMRFSKAILVEMQYTYHAEHGWYKL